MLVVLSSGRVCTFAILFINIKANFEMSNSLLEIQDIHWVLQMPPVILLLLSRLQFSLWDIRFEGSFSFSIIYEHL